MPDIQITVRNKIAQVQGNPEIVCGNSDYTVTFDFDAEWDAYEHKTAHFSFLENGVPRYFDVIFTGNSVQIPAVWNTCEMLIGAYAGDIRTTTAAAVPCVPCITDDEPVHPDPPPDVYAQIVELLENQKKSGIGVISPMIIVPSSILVDHCEYDGYNVRTLNIATGGGNVKWDSSITDLHPYASYEYLEPDSTAAKNMLGDTIPHELPSRPLAMRFDVRDTDGNALSVNARFYVRTPDWKYLNLSNTMVDYGVSDWFTPNPDRLYQILDRIYTVDDIFRAVQGVEFAIKKGDSSYVLSAGEIASATVDVYF